MKIEDTLRHGQELALTDRYGDATWALCRANWAYGMAMMLGSGDIPASDDPDKRTFWVAYRVGQAWVKTWACYQMEKQLKERLSQLPKPKDDREWELRPGWIFNRSRLAPDVKSAAEASEEAFRQGLELEPQMDDPPVEPHPSAAAYIQAQTSADEADKAFETAVEEYRVMSKTLRKAKRKISKANSH